MPLGKGNHLIANYIYQLVQKYSLTDKQRGYVDIYSTARGGHGGRGFVKNTLGLEIGWWVHPDRYKKEITAIDKALELKGNETIITFGCGPAFHEIALAHQYPNLNITASDFDPLEIETAKKIATQAEVPHIHFKVLNLEQAHQNLPNHSFDRVICLAALHDVANLERSFATVEKLLKPNGKFIFTYNPGRRKAQFPDAPTLEQVLSKYLTLVYSGPLITADDALEYYGDIELLSRRTRGYGLIQELRIAVSNI